MDNIFNLLGVIFLFILGGGVFCFLKDRNAKTPVDLPTPPAPEELKIVREEKENELRKEDSNTFIDKHLDNAGDVNDVKRTSDDVFDDILDKHRDNLDR